MKDNGIDQKGYGKFTPNKQKATPSKAITLIVRKMGGKRG
jgi:hypothetical protein